jgi:hypothetical protein
MQKTEECNFQTVVPNRPLNPAGQIEDANNKKRRAPSSLDPNEQLLGKKMG